MRTLLAGFAALNFFAIALLLMTATPVSAQSGSCLDRECFYDRQVRDFRVIDSDTVIVYVGADRCPYLVKTQGFFCDLKYIPDIDFFHEREWRMNERRYRGRSTVDQIFGNRAGANGALGTDRGDGFTRNDRICPNTAPQYALDTFGFGIYSQDEIPLDQAECPVVSVTQITDDDLVELYTQEGMAPPPPIGNGTISRADDSGDAAD